MGSSGKRWRLVVRSPLSAESSGTHEADESDERATAYRRPCRNLPAVSALQRGWGGREMIEEILAAWRINNRINFRLIERISDAGMRCTLSKRGGRNVVRQFAHLHYVRVYHLKKRAKPLAKGLRVFATHEEPDRQTLTAALNDSSRQVEQWFRLASEGKPGIRTLKRGLIPTVAYLISHESHHRGNILLTLKQSGHPVDSRTRYSIWDWDRV